MRRVDLTPAEEDNMGVTSPVQRTVDHRWDEEAGGEVAVLERGLPVETMEREMARWNRRAETGYRALAFYLADMQQRRVFQLLGFPSTVGFAVTRLELSRRKARALLAVGMALEELPVIDRAFREGRLSWTKVRTLVEVATPKTEGAWVERAVAVSTERLERETAASEKGRTPRDDDRGLPHVRVDLRFRVNPLVEEMWQRCRAMLSAQAAGPLSDEDVLRAVLESGLKTAEPQADSAFRVVVRRCDGCRKAAVETTDGEVPISDTFGDVAACDGETVDLDGVAAASNGPTPAALRRRVLARDGYRCRSCGSRHALHAHHVTFRSQGGVTAMENLATLCHRCHALVHDELLTVSGDVSAGLHFSDRQGVDRQARADMACMTLDIPARAAGDIEVGASETLLPAEVDGAWWRERSAALRWSVGRSAFMWTPETAMTAARAVEQANPVPTLRLADVIGQHRVRESLGLAVRAAATCDRPLPHVLLSGAPGLGKTRLAEALAGEAGLGFRLANGPLLADPGMLIGLLAEARDRDVVFIDEIHALPRRVAEVLYEAMQDGRITLPVIDRHRTHQVILRLPLLTVVGATTDPHLLPRPLRDRFGRQEILDPYDIADLAAIVTRRAAGQGVVVEAPAARLIAKAACGTPRRALALVAIAQDVAAVRAERHISSCVAERAVALAGLDGDGADRMAQRAKEILVARRGRPLGGRRLAALLRTSLAVFRETVEPALLVCRAIESTRSGWAWVPGVGR